MWDQQGSLLGRSRAPSRTAPAGLHREELEVDALKEDIPLDESRNPPSSSEESTGSWSQLANEEDNPDDTSSFLQLSERSMRYVLPLLLAS